MSGTASFMKFQSHPLVPAKAGTRQCLSQRPSGFQIRGNERVIVSYFFPSTSQPNFSRALRVTSGLGVLVGGNLSRQWNGRQASITATEWVMSPAARRDGG